MFSQSSISHSQSVGVLCSHWVIQHSHSSFSDSGGVSGPSDRCSRSTSRDTDEGKCKLTENYGHIMNSDVTCGKCLTLVKVGMAFFFDFNWLHMVLQSNCTEGKSERTMVSDALEYAV